MRARYGDTGMARLLYRNHLLFTVKNVGGPAFLLGFFLMLPYRVLSPLRSRVSRTVGRVHPRRSAAVAGIAAPVRWA